MKSLTAWKSLPYRKPLILRGARQTGKTYILKEFGRQYFQNYHYINFEDDENLAAFFVTNLSPGRIVNELQFYLDKAIDIQNDLLIFDEIQNCPRALTSLKYFNEEMPDAAVCAAGSLLGVTLSRESFPVGKVEFLDLFPMTYYEFLSAFGERKLAALIDDLDLSHPLPIAAHQKLLEYWKKYLVIGGMPEAVKTFTALKANEFEAFKTVRGLQNNLIDAYMMDIAKHAGKQNTADIERLWRNIPAQLGRTQNGKARKFRFKNVLPGKKGYERLAGPLSWIESTGLAIRVSIVDKAGFPLSSFVKENRFKLYFFDIGLLGAVSKIMPAVLLNYEFGSYKGYIAENFIAQELQASGLKQLCCWEGKTSEVEFLLETDSGIIPIEVKAGKRTQAKSLKVYIERYNPAKSIVISSRNLEKSGSRVYLPLYAVDKIL